MDLKLIREDQKDQYNKVVTHIIQSWQWGEVKIAQGVRVLRYGSYEGKTLKEAFSLTLHKIPFLKKNVGFLPKGSFPNQELAQTLQKIGKENNCAFVKVEPDIEKSLILNRKSLISPLFHPSPKPLFTKYNFVLDLTKSEDELLKNMHPKTRYNIKVAQKKGVKVEERLDDEAFEIYLKLYFETTKRQGYHGHNRDYHRKVWEVLKKANMARLLIAFYHPPQATNPVPLTAWMLFNFKDTLYYPYGGSSEKYKEVMASNLVAWEAIKLGKKLKLKQFDMWGALGPNPNPKDPWYGFHRFKAGFGGKLVEYIGSFDLILDPLTYYSFTSIDKFTKLKVLLLKLLGL